MIIERWNEDRPSRGRRRRRQITAKLLMTQTPSGVEEMCQLVRERCCSLSKLAPERKSSSAGSTASFLTAHASPGGAKGEITSHQRDCYWTIPCSAFVALVGCYVSTCGTQRVSTDDHGQRVTRRALTSQALSESVSKCRRWEGIHEQGFGPPAGAVRRCIELCHETEGA
ncbi:uncharacterized protein K444DRAFT_174184 [Hyaloscypha bicolor E]|uniref:Uncharacterized protein n=1 Tax=Hyaloscypha bicolor E TaxID=1095630 RepID=A0A2J6TQA8_9HELO|nr:uncharacterized protein K444DRAFT_174184 [Hyaloscypha bicolor E]PMD65213.1 hypothetical protein K444DRAFT_174184 [Hyaloscypha bicolor E]